MGRATSLVEVKNEPATWAVKSEPRSPKAQSVEHGGPRSEYKRSVFQHHRERPFHSQRPTEVVVAGTPAGRHGWLAWYIPATRAPIPLHRAPAKSAEHRPAISGHRNDRSLYPAGYPALTTRLTDEKGQLAPSSRWCASTTETQAHNTRSLDARCPLCWATTYRATPICVLARSRSECMQVNSCWGMTGREKTTLPAQHHFHARICAELVGLWKNRPITLPMVDL